MALSEADLVELDRIAVREAVRVVDLAGEDDWERDSPCAGWTLRRLVAHMTAQHHGFAAAARGRGQDAARWREPRDMSEPAKTHRAAAAAVLDAFGEPGSVGAEFALGGSFPGRRAVGFHLVDYVAHAWDVAATLGLRVRLPEDVLGAALAIARRVPADPALRGPGFAFAPVVRAPEEADGSGPLEETLRLLGRRPERWPVRE
ncbi:TIGR03086 family metal-binding protein [Streptomyces collinus]|uniref:TIGR03086 family metal-binding protein n=1 Tax=Streptomyces collinus TaxID=42684 RepID=UPI0029436F5C|nr:TIGR03086 family metal-binding protein [Streptomyces collinus]